MALRQCPVCGISVKLENLERHVANVHPHQKPSVALSQEDRQAVREASRSAGPTFRIRRSTLAAGLILSLAVVGMVLAVPYFSNLPPSGSIHWHPHLTIVINNQTVTIPANIGIDASLWADHSLDPFGMTGMAPLHTHDTSGKIHTESNAYHLFTIGDFFRVWGQSFDASQVLGHAAQSGHRVWMVVDGTSAAPSYSLVLRDQMQIEIMCGPG